MNEIFLLIAGSTYGLIEVVKFLVKNRDNQRRLGKTNTQLVTMEKQMTRIEEHLQRDMQSKTEFWVLLKEIALNQRRTSEILDKIVDKMNSR